MKSPSTHEYNLYMQTDVVDTIACSRDASSDLSYFVDPLLVSDGSTHAFDCNLDTFQAYSFNTADTDPHSHLQGNAVPTIEAGLESINVSPACLPVQTPKSKQRISWKSLKNKKGNRVNIKKGRNRLSKSVRRTITNNTYLRRLYLSPSQALSLFPGLSAGFAPMTQSRQVRSEIKHEETAHQVINLISSDGRHWSSVLECAVSLNGQLHCRLVKGWSQFCRDNGVAVYDSVVFEPATSKTNEIVARIERKGKTKS